MACSSSTASAPHYYHLREVGVRNQAASGEKAWVTRGGEPVLCQGTISCFKRVRKLERSVLITRNAKNCLLLYHFAGVVLEDWY